jgi:hypothetical protein
VIESSNQRLVSLYNTGYSLTWHEFQRFMSEDPWASVTFIRNGETFELEQAADMPELVELTPLHQFIGFRYVTEEPLCLW